MRTICSFLLGLALALPCVAQAPLVPGQPDTANRYQAIHAKASAGETVTVQQPASPSTFAQFEVAVINCSTAGVVSFAQNGTAATSTKLATTALNRSQAPSQATAWSGSNVGGGTAVGIPINIPALGTVTVDLSKFYLDINSGTAANFSVTVTSGCGASNIMIQWTEH